MKKYLAGALLGVFSVAAQAQTQPPAATEHHYLAVQRSGLGFFGGQAIPYDPAQPKARFALNVSYVLLEDAQTGSHVYCGGIQLKINEGLKIADYDFALQISSPELNRQWQNAQQTAPNELSYGACYEIDPAAYQEAYATVAITDYNNLDKLTENGFAPETTIGITTLVPLSEESLPYAETWNMRAYFKEVNPDYSPEELNYEMAKRASMYLLSFSPDPGTCPDAGFRDEWMTKYKVPGDAPAPALCPGP